MNKKKFLAMLLSLTMLGSIFSVPVYADNTDANTVDIVDTANTPDTASEETETPLPYTEEENAEDYVPDMEDNNTAVYSEPEYEQTVSLMATSLSGAGTSNSPYLIYNKNDLLQLSASTDTTFLSAHFQLQNDITLTSDNWSPIGINKSTPFKGTFDGNGHIINNVNIPENSYSYAGLFGVVTGTIRNLGVASDIEGVSTAGALAGLLYGGTVEYCYSTGAVSSTSGYTGGLIGYSEDSTIHDCYSMASATNTSTSGSVGGLSGYLYAHSNNTTVKDCYATGAVTGSCKNIGGLIGGTAIYYSNSSNNITNCYYDNYVDTSTDKGTYISSEDMKKQSTYSGWDFGSIWTISSTNNNGYPSLQNVSTEIKNHTPGDVNGDGKVNNQDGTLLLRHLAGWNVNIDDSALDINGDGKVNNQDGTVLLRYLAGCKINIY